MINDYWRIGVKLRKLISDFQFVPYKLRKGAKHKVGSIYWCGYWQQIYKVLEVNGSKIKVEWDDGKVTEHMTSLDPIHDYELKPFEYQQDGRIVDRSVSYTAAEIKALIYNNQISDKNMADYITEYYLNNTACPPNDYTYYYLVSGDITHSSRPIKLMRDLKKSPHNFNNIKVFGDVQNDNRIGGFETRDRNNEFIISCDIPKDTKVIEVKHNVANRYIIILDIEV